MVLPRALCWLAVSAILLELVSGAPLFWSLSQRDCDQPLSYQYETYQQPGPEPGPSYQETLQQMVHETLAALRDIVLVTAQVTREELQALARDLYRKAQNCDDGSAGGDIGDEQGVAVEGPEVSEGNGYHYDTPNKNTFTIENTIPDSYDTDKGDMENNINLNKQTFGQTVEVTEVNGYNYDNPNKNMLTIENTNPNSHHSEKGEMENNINLNKQTFENENSTEVTTTVREASTDVETTTSNEVTTELVDISTITTLDS